MITKNIRVEENCEYGPTPINFSFIFRIHKSWDILENKFDLSARYAHCSTVNNFWEVSFETLGMETTSKVNMHWADGIA